MSETKPAANILSQVAEWLSGYIVFTDETQPFVTAAWAIATHCWPDFHAFPYLTITARTKRAGKTLLGIDLLQYIVANGKPQVAPTPASVFRLIKNEHPTLIFDEAESNSSEAKSVMHALMNAGYKKGAVVTRAHGKDETRDWEAHCPKVFILIGDASDTLRDRAIVIELRRAMQEPSRMYDSATAEAEGAALREVMHLEVEQSSGAIIEAYKAEKAEFLISGRDRELWRPLLAIAKVFSPESYERMKAAAVDFATAKTAPKIQVDANHEKLIEQMEYAHKLSADCKTIGQVKAADYPNGIKNTELLEELRGMTLSPWRKYLGTGLDLHSLGELMQAAGYQREGNSTSDVFRRGKQVMRGYKWSKVALMHGNPVADVQGAEEPTGTLPPAQKPNGGYDL